MAYINPQYQIDMQQDQRANQNYAAIGDAVKGGIKWQEENRQRALANRRSQFATAADLAAKGVATTPEEMNEYTETGYSQGLLDKYAAKAEEARQAKLLTDSAKNKKLIYENEQLEKPLNQRDSYIQSIDKSRALGGMQEEVRIKAEQRALENDKTKQLNTVKIQDFDFASPDVIPTDKDAESVKKLNTATKNFERLATEADSILKTFDNADLTGLTNKYKKYQQKVGEMRLQQKNIKDLGVLNGPDLPLVDSTLGDISNLSTLVRLGKDNASARLGEALSNAKNNLVSEVGARGYRPRQTENTKKQEVPQFKDPEQNKAYQWAIQNQNNPDAAEILNRLGVNK